MFFVADYHAYCMPDTNSHGMPAHSLMTYLFQRLYQEGFLLSDPYHVLEICHDIYPEMTGSCFLSDFLWMNMTGLQWAVKNGENDHINRFFSTLGRLPGDQRNVGSTALIFSFFFPRGAEYAAMNQPFHIWWVSDVVNLPFSLYPRQKGSPSYVPHPGWCLVYLTSLAPAMDNEGCARGCGLLASYRMVLLRKWCLP